MYARARPRRNVEWNEYEGLPRLQPRRKVVGLGSRHETTNDKRRIHVRCFILPSPFSPLPSPFQRYFMERISNSIIRRFSFVFVFTFPLLPLLPLSQTTKVVRSKGLTALPSRPSAFFLFHFSCALSLPHTRVVCPLVFGAVAQPVSQPERERRCRNSSTSSEKESHPFPSSTVLYSL